MDISLIDSAVFNLFLTNSKIFRRVLRTRVMMGIYRTFSARNRLCRITIHGRSAVMRFGYTYPFTARLFETFNNPLLALIHTTFKELDRPVRFMDVGAAIGDTILLIDSNLSEAVSHYICIDGDKEFFSYLKSNLNHLSNVTSILSQLSRNGEKSAELIRVHPGTASAQGSSRVTTACLDNLVSRFQIGEIDVLKVDIDGFDGEALSGAYQLLRCSKPNVIFEWHPILCKNTHNDYYAAFDTLHECGYTTFLWFNKYGVFSHFMMTYDRQSIKAQAEYCMGNIESDWHYDIIALHESRRLSSHQCLELAHYNKRKSLY